MNSPKERRATRFARLFACLLGLTATAWWVPTTLAQDAEQPGQPVQPSRTKPRERQRATTKKTEEPKPTPTADEERARDGETPVKPQPTPPQPEPLPGMIPPGGGMTPDAPAGVKLGSPEGIAAPPAELPRKEADEGQMDPAKRVEEARKAAAERAAARRARAAGPGAQPNVTTTPGVQPPAPPMPQPNEPPSEGQVDAGPATPINIAPADTTVPPEERMYGFSIKEGTYEQLIEGFARQTGLGVIGEAPKDGKVSFVTTEKLNFDQALARVRMLLFNYKPHEPYWILRNESNLQVIRVNDFYRILPRDRMFSSVDEFRTANLSIDELALVIYTPKTGSVADLKQVRDWLPDYVRVTPLEDQNRVTIFALVSDIEKYLGLIDFLAGGSGDPRVLERVEVRHIQANDALNKLRSLMDLEGAASKGGVGAPSRRAPREPSALDNMPEPAVSIIADDAQGLLIVRAMQNKINEIKMLLPFIDVDTSGSTPTPVIIKVQHVEAGELINTIQQVLSFSAAPVGSPVPPKPKKGKRTGTPGTPATTVPAGEGLAPDSVTLIRHPSDNAIVVLADEAGVAKVRELVTMFDVASKPKPVRIALAHADGNEILNTVTAVMGAANPQGKASLDRFSIVLDPAADALWFTGSEKDLEDVRELIALIDVAEAPVVLHTYRCVYQQPTFLANMLREFESTNPTSPAPAPATKRPKTKRVKASAPASKFTPDDAQKTLYVICSDEEWSRYEPLIGELDRPAGDREAFVRVPVVHVTPDAAIERLTPMLSGSPGGDEAGRLVAGDGAILVMDANPLQLERIKVFLAEVDKPTVVEKRTFEIRHAEPGDIKAAIETLLGDAPVQPTTRKRSKVDKSGGVAVSMSAELTIVEIGRRLVVHTTPERMEQVAALIAEFDVAEEKTELKVYSDFPPGTNLEAMAETISSVFAGTGKGGDDPPKTAALAENRG